MTMRSGDREPASAITLRVVRFSDVVRTTRRSRGRLARARAVPAALLSASAGMRTPGRCSDPGNVPLLPRRPSFMISTAAAPAACALSALRRSVQVPRWTSAISPRRSIEKAPRAQPDAEADPGATSIARTAPESLPAPENCSVSTSRRGRRRRPGPSVRVTRGGAASSKKGNVTGCVRTRSPAARSCCST
jgi:hypothetical protein